MQCCDIEYTEDKLLNIFFLFPKLDISRFSCDFGQKYAQVDEANHVLNFHRPTYTPFSISVCLIVCFHQHFTLFLSAALSGHY